MLQKRLSEFELNQTTSDIYHQNFLDFRSPNFYDLVIAEGCLPGQDSPEKTLTHISNFVAPSGGIIVVTTTSKQSMLAEILRGVIARRLQSIFQEFESWVGACVTFFDSHLKTLGPNRRSTRDWVIDNVIQYQFLGKLDFSLQDALGSLKGFRLIGSSPTFFTDSEWYKQNLCDLSIFNFKMLSQYQLWRINEIDYRTASKFSIEDKFFLDKLMKISNQCFDLGVAYIKSKHNISPNTLLIKLKSFSELLKNVFPETAKSINNFVEVSNSLFSETYSGKKLQFDEFESWFGRGQQYVGFIKL